MTDYTLKIYRRTKPAETIGLLENRIGLEATEESDARNESRKILADLNWDTHFAAMEAEAGKFITFWANKNA